MQKLLPICRPPPSRPARNEIAALGNSLVYTFYIAMYYVRLKKLFGTPAWLYVRNSGENNMSKSIWKVFPILLLCQFEAHSQLQVFLRYVRGGEFLPIPHFRTPEAIFERLSFLAQYPNGSIRSSGCRSMLLRCITHQNHSREACGRSL